MKRIFIIHGWGDTPKSNFIPWLKESLERKGFSVSTPAMPDTDNPKVEEWVSYLSSQVGEPDAQTYLIGHSMGCQAIIRYLSTLEQGKVIGGALLIAGFVRIKDGVLSESEKPIIKPWTESQIDWEKAAAHSRVFVSIFSDNDPYIDHVYTSKLFAEKLESNVIIMHNAMHFREKDGYKELRQALDEMLKIAKAHKA